ncbi:RHA2B [Symbiodinium sp. CCMP2456]|nr:RHA2B [Symbiodinium sp. CCMP2456]
MAAEPPTTALQGPGSEWRSFVPAGPRHEIIAPHELAADAALVDVSVGPSPCPALWQPFLERPPAGARGAERRFAPRWLSSQRRQFEHRDIGHGVGIWQSTFHGDIAHIFRQGRRVRYMPNELPEDVSLPRLAATTWRPEAPEASSADCAICLAALEPGCKVSSLPCRHVFHVECIERWMLQAARVNRALCCPLCRTQVPESPKGAEGL